jgi:hypothetical protein
MDQLVFNGAWSVFQKPTAGAYYTFGTGYQLDAGSQAQRVSPEQQAQLAQSKAISPNDGYLPADDTCAKQYVSVAVSARVKGADISDDVSWCLSVGHVTCRVCLYCFVLLC